MEVFLPFFHWFDVKKDIRPESVKGFLKMLKGYGMEDLRSVHAGYAGQGFLLARFFMNPGDPRARKENIVRIKKEFAVLRELRNELGLSHPLIYVIHAGRVEKGMGKEESVHSMIVTLKEVMEDAARAGVCVSVENVFSYPGEQALGTGLEGIGEILYSVGQDWIDKGVLGWTFDPAHALLSYSGNYEAIQKDMEKILPWCVHIHVNHPRTVKNRAGELFSEWSLGDDNHNAPIVIPQRKKYWSLLRDIILKSKIPQWRTLTYEVNWAVPFLHPIFGGSNLQELKLGWEALDRFCNHPHERFDVDAIDKYIEGRLGR